MTKRDDYRQTLTSLDQWDAYLMQESGLPGPRANLELMQVVADQGDEALFRRYLAGDDPDQYSADSPESFLAMCGVMGLGKLLAEGRTDLLPALRLWTSDRRWRLREAIVFALQRWGQADMDALLAEMEGWSRGNLLERRPRPCASIMFLGPPPSDRTEPLPIPSAIPHRASHAPAPTGGARRNPAR